MTTHPKKELIQTTYRATLFFMCISENMDRKLGERSTPGGLDPASNQHPCWCRSDVWKRRDVMMSREASVTE